MKWPPLRLARIPGAEQVDDRRVHKDILFLVVRLEVMDKLASQSVVQPSLARVSHGVSPMIVIDPDAVDEVRPGPCQAEERQVVSDASIDGEDLMKPPAPDAAVEP